MAVRNLPGDLGPGEFSFGEGLMPDPAKGYVPSPADQLHALHRVNQDPASLDATGPLTYDAVVVPNQKDPE